MKGLKVTVAGSHKGDKYAFEVTAVGAESLQSTPSNRVRLTATT